MPFSYEFESLILRLRRRKDCEVAIRAGDEPVVLKQSGVNIGDTLALMQDFGLTYQPPFTNTDMIIHLEFDGGAPDIIIQHPEQSAAHRRIGERVGDSTMRHALRVKMGFGINIDQHTAKAGTPLFYDKTEQLGEFEIVAERPQRTRGPPKGGGGGGRRVPRGNCA
jgi:hypothetical protein